MKAAGSEKAPEFEESEEAYERGEADRTETKEEKENAEECAGAPRLDTEAAARAKNPCLLLSGG
jgi:hypothetical protein